MTDEINTQVPSTSGEPDPAVVAVTETRVYADGSTATGPGPLPDQPSISIYKSSEVGWTEGPSPADPQGLLQHTAEAAMTDMGLNFKRITDPEKLAAIEAQIAARDSADPVSDNAPPPDPALIQTSTGGVRTSINELEHARALPEIADGVAFHEARAAEGTIHHFYDEAVNEFGIVERRVMRVVVAMDGLLHKIHMPNFGE